MSCNNFRGQRVIMVLPAFKVKRVTQELLVYLGLKVVKANWDPLG
jgi:hypothetical protein